MDSRERLLTAINNQKPDRLPCQVHGWMWYYLQTYLNGMDQFQAYEYFDMDAVLYVLPNYIYDQNSYTDWHIEVKDLGADSTGQRSWIEIYRTPEGELRQGMAANQYTMWVTEPIIKTERDFEIWAKYIPLPVQVDWSPVEEAKARIGKKGIVRGVLFDFGQGSPWQSFCYLIGTQEAIMLTYDNPEWVHHVLNTLLEKKLRVLEIGEKIPYDLVEVGGGAGSSTVISPKLHREFCLPYDKKQIEVIHSYGPKVIYHLCGGVMPMLDIVVENGADGLETMTPPDMGGDCDLAEAERRVGDKLFFVGGFDQNAGFEKGTPEKARELVRACHAACPNGGYICSPSDHFFFGNPENIKAFADEAKKCVYE